MAESTRRVGDTRVQCLSYNNGGRNQWLYGIFSPCTGSHLSDVYGCLRESTYVVGISRFVENTGSSGLCIRFSKCKPITLPRMGVGNSRVFTVLSTAYA
jgi:hypothetical protein